MADIKDRVQGIIKAMEDLSEAGEITTDDLANFVQVLESIGGISGQFAPKMSKIARSIQQMSTALSNVGASKGYIDRLKTSLMELAGEYENTGVAAAKLKGLGLVGREQGMATFEQQRAIEAKYFQKALMGVGEGQSKFDPNTDLQSQIGARATALRLADEMQKKVLTNFLAEKQLTLEIEAQNIAREESLLIFAQQPGLGQAYGRIIAQRPEAPPALTTEQIREQQDAQYASLKRTGGHRQLFDPVVEGIVKYHNALEALKAEVEESQKAQDAYNESLIRNPEYSARLAAGLAKRDFAQQVEDLKTPEPQEIRVPLGEALQQYKEFIPGGEVGIANLTTKLEALGVTEVNTLKAFKEISNGVTTMTVRMQDASGAVIGGSVHMDKFGNVLQDTSRRFKSFTDAIGTNILKVTQWAVATGLVYGAVRQVGQVLQEIIEVQSKMASVQIALGKGQGNLNKVFEEAIQIANLTSSSVAGVIESYAIAYRATGQYSDEVERVAITNNLLQESMVLAQLAGIDQATAIDTLVGALRQTGLELDKGRDLLDKWVFVSRRANVSLDTLAQTYSIVGTTAKGVGIEMEELNALAATLAEATGLSATETGNALRGIISGFQSATSEQTLARFGIATRDATGKLRDFMGLYQELAVLTQSGVLSDRDISEIANAIGGGYRRGAQVETLLKNNQTVARLTAEQAGASGAAAEALEINMATLESAIQRLGNAFTEFAQSLGSEGGFLELITSIVDAMSGFLQLITNLTSGLGKATPAILAFAAAWMVLGSTRGQDLFKGIINKEIGPGGLVGRGLGAVGLGPNLATQQMMEARAGGQYSLFPPTQTTVGGAFQQGRGGIKGALGGLDPLGLVVPLLIAGSAVKKGLEEGPGVKQELEFGRAATSLVGTIVGGIVGGGTPLGLAAGSAMASSFYEGVVQYEDNFADFWAGVVRKAEEERVEDEEGGGPPPEEMLTFGPRLGAGLQSAMFTLSQWLGATGEGGAFGTGIGSRRGMDDIDPRAFVTKQAQALITYLETGEITSGFYGAVLGLDEETARAILEDTQNAMEGETIAISVELEIAEGIKGLKPVVDPIINEYLQEQQRKMVLGEVGLPDFIKLPTTLDTTKIATQLQKVVMAQKLVGEGYRRGGLDVEDYTAYMIQLDDATRQYLTNLADDVVKSHTEWQTALREQKLSLEEITALEEDFYSKRDRYQTMTPAVRQQFELEQIPRRRVFQAGRLTQDQVQLATKAAQAYTLQYNMKMTEGNEKLARDMSAQLEPFIVQHGEGMGRVLGETIGGTTIEALTAVIKDFGWDTMLDDVDFGFQDVRDSLGMEDIPDLMARYQKVVGTFQTYFPDYEVNEENVGLITKDGLTTVHADLTLLNLVMQDLLDVNEQQLEGVWNIPSGMTAMVAWSSLFTRDVGGGGAIPTEGDVFTEDRQDVPETDVLTGLQEQLAALNAIILDMQKVIAMGPEELGMQEIEAARMDIREAEKEKVSVLEQIALTQLGAGLGIEAMGDVSIADQLREALSIQNKIELNANIRLVVDGRTLANIVKQYLFEDLVTASDKVTGTGSGDYVIGH